MGAESLPGREKSRCEVPEPGRRAPERAVLGRGGGGASCVGEVGSGDPRGEWTSSESPRTLLPARVRQMPGHETKPCWSLPFTHTHELLDKY